MDTVIEGNKIRLRTAKLDEYVEVAVPWYQDAEVLKYSEGASLPYDRAMIRRMYETMSAKGEIYLNEVPDGMRWRAIGDAGLLNDALPIVIGNSSDRSRGFGTKVLQLLLDRAKQLGWQSVQVGGVLADNTKAIRLYHSAGFVDGQRYRADSGRLFIPMKKVLCK